MELNKLYCGDCFELIKNVPDESISLIIYEPPYDKSFLPTFSKIALEAKRVLVGGGSFLSIIPHYAAPQVLYDVGQYLKWRWIISMWQDKGAHPRMAMGIEVMWKPIGWWVKRAYPVGRGFVRDGFVNEHPAKKYHVWEQSHNWSDYCVKFAPVGTTILDPMIGTGTTAISCLMYGRNFIGFDISETQIAIAEQRIKEYENLSPL